MPLPQEFATGAALVASRLRHRCAAATLPLQARARTRDSPAPCDGRPAPHAWPSTHQPRHQHCMVSHQELLDRETPPQVSQEHCMVWVHACGGVGRLRRTPHPLHRACAGACCTTPTRTSSARRKLACLFVQHHAPRTSLLPHTAVHARTRCLQQRPSWHLSLARSRPRRA